MGDSHSKIAEASATWELKNKFAKFKSWFLDPNKTNKFDSDIIQDLIMHLQNDFHKILIVNNNLDNAKKFVDSVATCYNGIQIVYADLISGLSESDKIKFIDYLIRTKARSKYYSILSNNIFSGLIYCDYLNYSIERKYINITKLILKHGASIHVQRTRDMLLTLDENTFSEYLFDIINNIKKKNLSPENRKEFNKSIASLIEDCIVTGNYRFAEIILGMAPLNIKYLIDIYTENYCADVVQLFASCGYDEETLNKLKMLVR
jgi:hypothetical protein